MASYGKGPKWLCQEWVVKAWKTRIHEKECGGVVKKRSDGHIWAGGYKFSAVISAMWFVDRAPELLGCCGHDP